MGTKRKFVSEAIFVVLVGLFAGVYAECFYEATYGLSTGLMFNTPTLGSIARAGLVLVVTAVISLFVLRQERVLPLVFRYRYLLAILFVVLCVVLSLSGSSIGQWANYVSSDNNGTLFGASRPIRSDEWAVFTPFAFAQGTAGYPAVSDVIRGMDTQVTIVYGQPSWSIATLFRPFLWGYLVLGSTGGLSFFWMARIACLFLATFECARLFTRDDKYLSTAYAVAITCAPITQWWFAVNGTAELLIFGHGLVVLLYQLLHATNLKLKILWSALMAWFAGGFIMVIYPAWQVCLFYAFAAMGIWLGISYYREIKGRASQDARLPVRCTVIPLVVSLLVMAGLIGFSLYQGLDAVKATTSTVYPGSRCETGGGMTDLLFNWGYSLFLAIDPSIVSPNNAPESSVMFNLFPLGTILGVVTAVRKRDTFCIPLLVAQFFFLAFGCIGFPQILAKITLLSNVTVTRLMLAVGLIETMLLFRAVALYSNEKTSVVARSQTHIPTLPVWAQVAVSIIGIAILFVGCLAGKTSTYRMPLTALLAILIALWVVIIVLCICAKGNYTRWVCVLVLFTIGLAGFCVNPVQRGTDVILDSEQVNEIESLVDADADALWITDADRFPDNQVPMIAGAKTINCTNVYPALSRWHILDPTGAYESCYNRYANILIDVQDNAETSFELVAPDSFTVHLNVDDLCKLNVGYIYSCKDLSEIQGEGTSLELVRQIDSTYIYRVVHN